MLILGWSPARVQIQMALVVRNRRGHTTTVTDVHLGGELADLIGCLDGGDFVHNGSESGWSANPHRARRGGGCRGPVGWRRRVAFERQLPLLPVSMIGASYALAISFRKGMGELSCERWGWGEGER